MSLNALHRLSAAFGSDSNQITNNTATTPTIADATRQIPESYSGGTLPVKVLRSDSQAQLVWRGLYKHAQEAGLDKQRAREFADKWTTANSTFNHRVNGESTPYTTAEFNALKKQGETSFHLTKNLTVKFLPTLTAS